MSVQLDWRLHANLFPVLRICISFLFLCRLYDVSMVCVPPFMNLMASSLIFSRLLNYTPPAVVIRLLTTNGLIAYVTSSVLYLSGASSDPRLLLPAWISITTVSCRCTRLTLFNERP